MANDPHRDLLPVKEDCCKTGKVSNEKFDHQILGKLSRCELEDRFLRLLDEQTHVKKLANIQEEKIKRLGTKLLRLINEKKNGKKFTDQSKEIEDLHLRVIELEHENYALKDKNIVLKQQLSSHSRHFSNQRSPIRSNHTSPLMSMRQSAPPGNSEIVYDATNKNGVVDVQLQEAEAHIRELNEEIKSLHHKIDYLQQNIERSSLDNRKVKVTENIELIRLQRSLKQQAIQIAALQAQVKNSENSQKLLKEELIRAHKENDDALHLLSEKQNEILNLCSKLEEKKLNKLEENELRERIHDLMLERDCLKENSDLLMKTIGTKTEESERINELKKLLAEEKLKKEKLEDALEATKKCSLKSPRRSFSCEVPPSEKFRTATQMQEAQYIQKKEADGSSRDNSEESENSYNKCKCNCSQEFYSNLEPGSDTESREAFDGKVEAESRSSHSEGKYAAEKMKLERELQYLREMLRSQTSRCEAQQVEISRLMYELKLNEDKCNETLRRLDTHLTIFEQLELRSRINDKSSGEPLKLKNAEVEKSESTLVPTVEHKNQKVSRSKDVLKSSSSEKKLIYNTKARRFSTEQGLNLKLNNEGVHVSSPLLNEPSAIVEDMEPKKRFVDQMFLDSSDEDLVHDEKPPFLKKLQDLERHEQEKSLKVKDEYDADSDEYESKFRSGSVNKQLHRKLSSDSLSSKQESSFQLRQSSSKETRKYDYFKSNSKQVLEGTIKISILWLQIKTSSSLWKNDNIKCIFVDFTFLDVSGEETETPDSLPKPSSAEEKCHFNYDNVIEITRNRREILSSLLKKPDIDLIVFKVISDAEYDDQINYECEDVGVAVVTVKNFKDKCNKDPFLIDVRNPKNMQELVGTLAIKLEATAGLFSVTRKSSRFTPRHEYPNSDRFMFENSDIPMFLMPSPYKIPFFKTALVSPYRRRGFKRKQFGKNSFLCKRNFSSRKTVRKKFLKKRKRDWLPLPEVADSFINYVPQCFESYWLSGSGLHFESDLGNVHDSRNSVTVRNPNQYIVCVYPVFDNKKFRFKKRTFRHLKKLRFSALEGQYLTNLGSKRSKNKRSTSSTSTTNETASKEKSEIKRANENPSENMDFTKRFSLPPIDLDYDPFKSSDYKSRHSFLPPSRPLSHLGTPHLDYLSPQFPYLYNNYMDVNVSPMPLPKINFKYPYDPNLYESSLRTDSSKDNGKKGLNEKLQGDTDDNSPPDLLKLKDMLEEVEMALKGIKKHDSNMKDLKKQKGGGSSEKKKNKSKSKSKDDDVISHETLKQKIDDVAIPILAQISRELGKLAKSTPKSSTSSSSNSTSENAKTVKKSNIRCSADGRWTSSVLGIDMTFTTMPNMMLRVKIENSKDSMINQNWSIHGLTLSKNGGPLMLAAIYPQKRKIASFVGQCKVCRDQDLIFGSWTIYTCVRRFSDLWRAVEIKLDVLRKQNGQHEEEKSHKVAKKKENAIES